MKIQVLGGFKFYEMRVRNYEITKKAEFSFSFGQVRNEI